MQIRFKKFTPIGSTHYNAGESYDFPATVAQQLIADGNAVAMTKAEFARLPRYGVHAAVPPVRRSTPPQAS